MTYYRPNRSGIVAPLASLILCAATLVGTGCSGGGGGGDGDGLGSSLDIVFAIAEDGGELPQEGLFLNQRLVIQFTEPLDPDSVTPDTVQVRRSTGGFAVPAGGDLVVNNDQIIFVPTLPSNQDLSDAGLQADTTYRVFLPGYPNPTTVRSERGRPLSNDFQTTFRTRTSAPLLVDTVPGNPRIEAIFIDSNRDGAFDADGLRTTPNSEEYFPEQFASLPPLPTGAASAPSLIGILLNEPVLPPTVFEDLDFDGSADNVFLQYTADSLEQPVRLELSQEFRPTEDRFFVLITIRPRFTLRGLSSLVLQTLSGIQDFATPPNSLPQLSIPLTTAATVPTDDAFIEDFSTNDFADPEGTAQWNVSDSGLLVAGVGLGGNGSDGPFTPTEVRVVVETNAVNNGLFNFTNFIVPPGTEVVFEGIPPVRINVLGTCNIAGRLTLAGRDGQVAIARGTITIGGLGGPGAGRGGNGNPNGLIETSFSGETGESAPRVINTVGCNIGQGLRLGGGCAGRRSASGAGSGAGGGHRDIGASDNAVSPSSGLGGIAYGDATISDLRGGSGGGGGGNDEDNQPFQNDDPGGAGGGGGGAIAFNVAGAFEFSGVINADAGRGGGGFQQSGGGGGGSGGAIKIQALSVADLMTGTMSCRSGLGGTGSAPGRPGGAGSAGRIRLETVSGTFNVDRTQFMFDPPESTGTLSLALLGKSVGRSLFYNTGVLAPIYGFNGSDPNTGLLTPGPAATDLVMTNGLPEGTFASILFYGAHADPADASRPDLASVVGPVTDIAALNGLQFVRFDILFDIGLEPDAVERPRIESLRLRFFFQ